MKGSSLKSSISVNYSTDHNLIAVDDSQFNKSLSLPLNKLKSLILQTSGNVNFKVQLDQMFPCLIHGQKLSELVASNKLILATLDIDDLQKAEKDNVYADLIVASHKNTCKKVGSLMKKYQEIIFLRKVTKYERIRKPTEIYATKKDESKDTKRGKVSRNSMKDIKNRSFSKNEASSMITKYGSFNVLSKKERSSKASSIPDVDCIYLPQTHTQKSSCSHNTKTPNAVNDRYHNGGKKLSRFIKKKGSYCKALPFIEKSKQKNHSYLERNKSQTHLSTVNNSFH